MNRRPSLKIRIDIGRAEQNGFGFSDFEKLAKLKHRPSYTAVGHMFNRNWRTIKSWFERYDEEKGEIMDKKAILEKAIQKAIDGGWINSERLRPFRRGDGSLILKSVPFVKGYDVEHVIFNHDFAKALWGEEATYDMTHRLLQDNTTRMNVKPAWQYHLQQMVIADDPIKYLAEHI